MSIERDGRNSPDLPPPVGPFSHLVQSGGFLFASGAVGEHPETGRLVAGDITAQAEQAFANLRTVLRTAGADLAHVVKVTVYLTDISDFAALNSVYARQFTAPYPARTTIAVAALPLGARVEIEAIARLP